MQALVLTQLTANEPTVLQVGDNCDGFTRVAVVDDYGVFLVSATTEQIAALGQVAIVEDADWTQPIAPSIAAALNALLQAGGYPLLPDGCTLNAGMVAVVGEFQAELYSVGESSAAVPATLPRPQTAARPSRKAKATRGANVT